MVIEEFGDCFLRKCENTNINIIPHCFVIGSLVEKEVERMYDRI